MPIFEYRCRCGFQKDYLKKADDLEDLICPVCQKDTLRRQLSAPASVKQSQGCGGGDVRPCQQGGCPFAPS